MSVFILKILAILSMVFDHAGYILYHHFSWMNYIGRFAFPIFAFLITEGYLHTHNLKKYFLRLFVFALLSQIPYMLFSSIITPIPGLNIFFTLLLGLLVIYLYETIPQKWIGWLCVIFSCVLAQVAHFDYGWYGIATIFLFHCFKDKKVWMYGSFILITFINYFYLYITSSSYEYLFIILFDIFTLLPLHFYNGKKGKSFKYFFYLFYPLHLLLLYGLHFCI